MQSTYLDKHSRLERIDGLRALAVVAVLFIHAQLLMPTPIFASLAGYGKLGVQLFFFLSGYIIYMAWERGNTSVGGFYWNRVARIAPLFYFLLVLTYVRGWSMSPDELNTENFIWHLFQMQGFSGSYAYAGIAPMWSLTSEVVFYLFFPFLVRFSTLTLAILCALSFVFGDVDTGMAYWLTGSTTLSFTPLGAAKYMLAGMLIYRHRDFFAQTWVVTVSGLFAVLLGALMLSTWLGYEFPNALPHGPFLLFACPFLMFTHIKPVEWVVENRISTFIGVTSYSIYLWQLPIVLELQKLGWNVDILTFTAIVLVVSAISYYVIERPFLKYFRAPEKKPAKPAVVAEQTA